MAFVLFAFTFTMWKKQLIPMYYEIANSGYILLYTQSQMSKVIRC